MVLKALRLPRPGSLQDSARALQALLRVPLDPAHRRLLHRLVLRSLARARYLEKDLGHFGLAAHEYCHFTSPIRRYPDLIVHRILGGALAGRAEVPPDLAAIGEEASRRERVALDAEREIVQLKKIQFMHDKVGLAYDGFVSGVVPFGFFVELTEVFVEGLVHVSALGDDFYEHLEGQHTLRGRRTRRTFRVGDAVRVAVSGVSLERRQIDFTLADTTERRTGSWRRRRPSS